MRNTTWSTGEFVDGVNGVELVLSFQQPDFFKGEEAKTLQAKWKEKYIEAIGKDKHSRDRSLESWQKIYFLTQMARKDKVFTPAKANDADEGEKLMQEHNQAGIDGDGMETLVRCICV